MGDASGIDAARVDTQDPTDSDGSQDIAVAQNGMVTTFIGNGGGGWSSHVDSLGVAGALALGDMNGDGKLDLVSANHTLLVKVMVPSGPTFPTVAQAILSCCEISTATAKCSRRGRIALGDARD